MYIWANDKITLYSIHVTNNFTLSDKISLRGEQQLLSHDNSTLLPIRIPASGVSARASPIDTPYRLIAHWQYLKSDASRFPECPGSHKLANQSRHKVEALKLNGYSVIVVESFTLRFLCPYSLNEIKRHSTSREGASISRKPPSARGARQNSQNSRRPSAYDIPGLVVARSREAERSRRVHEIARRR